jgi:sterol 3beta-glucosyltransferase
MINIAIAASGTRGDVQPYVALGKGLRDAGYHVRLLSSDNFEPLVTGAGLTFCSTGASIEEKLKHEEWRKTLERGNFLTILGHMQKEMKHAATDLAQRIPPLLAGSDLIISGMGGFGGVFSIAERMQIPVIQAHVFPFTPTQEFPSPLVPNLPFGRALNRLSFHVTHQMFWQMSKVGDAETRKMLGMPKAPYFGPYRNLARRQTPTMYGYSRYVLPRPQDWPEWYHVTGYWFLDESDDWQPPTDLIDFLKAGDPPVYIGFGSMSGGNSKEAGRIALEALARSGQRGVIATGWGGLEIDDLPDTVHMISGMPHSWLFPRMSAVVHHGGAGTTAAGMRAGVPSIIVPYMGDQPFWARRVVKLGVGPAPIPRKKLTSERLADAIVEAVTNKEMQQRASSLGANIRSEDGIGSAIALVDRITQHERTPHVI